MAATDRKNLKPAIYLGAFIAAILALAPLPSLLAILPYLLGPCAGVWFALRWQRHRLSTKESAEIGFLSAFYGVLAASAAYDVLPAFFRDQLWKLENANRLLALLSGGGPSTLFAWSQLIFQITLGAIAAGALAVPAGILALTLFTRERPL